MLLCMGRRPPSCSRSWDGPRLPGCTGGPPSFLRGIWPCGHLLRCAHWGLGDSGLLLAGGLSRLARAYGLLLAPLAAQELLNGALDQIVRVTVAAGAGNLALHELIDMNASMPREHV